MDYEKFIIRNKWWFIIGPIILTMVAVMLLTRIKINSNLESYFPDNLNSKVNSRLIEETFGAGEPLLLILENDDILNPQTLVRIENITNELSLMSIFDDVISLFNMKNIKGENGSMVVDPLISEIPQTLQEREELRETIRNNELAFKTFVSDNFRFALILIKVKKGTNDKEAVSAVEKMLQDFPGNDNYYLNGMPYLRIETSNKITRDLVILLPLAILIMIFFFLISFREFRGVWLPLSVVIISTAVSMAILPLMRWPLTLIGVLIPVMMIAIANNYGVHIIVRYQEFNAAHPKWSMHQITLKALSVLKSPIILTGLTTIVGILGLITHILIPARQIGYISAIGIGLALFLSLTFLPSLLSILKKGKIHKEFSETKNGVLGSILTSISRQIIARPKAVIVIFAVAFLIIGSCIKFMQVAPDNDKVLPKQHPYNQTISIANNNFGGTKFLSVMFEGDIQDPAVLKRIDNYETELKKLPEIGSVTSLASVIRIMSKALNDKGSPEYNAIPDTRDAIAQYLLLYTMSGDPEDFENITNFDYTKALLNIQFQASDMKTLNSVIDKINQLRANDPTKTTLGGYSLTDKEMSDSTNKGQIYSLVFALVAIFLLLVWIFRSTTAGLLGIIPLIFAVACTFGLMGIMGIELNIVTALLSSISIGVGVDYTIHIFWRLKLEFEQKKTYKTAIMQALKVTGRGIVINAFSVMLGFAVLLFSAFPYLKMFAILIILSLSLCLICALVLIPAICIVLKPKFLNVKENTNYYHKNKSK